MILLSVIHRKPSKKCLPNYDNCLKFLAKAAFLQAICIGCLDSAVAQNSSKAIVSNSAYAKDSLMQRWFNSDPFQAVKSASKAEALAISKAYELTDSEPNTQLAAEAKSLTLLVFNAFKNEYPEVMKNKEIPYLLISNGELDESPQALEYRNVGFIVYPEEIWRSQNEESRIAILAHEMVHYLFHFNRSSAIIWLKDKNGKIFDYRTAQAKKFETLLNLFTSLGIVKEEILGPFSSPLLVLDLLNALELYDSKQYCGLSIGHEKLAVSTFLFNTVQSDATNGRVVSSLVPEDIRVKTMNFVKAWRNCFAEIAKVRGNEWELKDFPTLNAVVSYLSISELPQKTKINPVDLVIEKLKEINSIFDSFLLQSGVEYSTLNYYTIEDQADELAAVVLQNQKIVFKRRSLIDISAFFDTVENLEFCINSLKINKPLNRSSTFIRLHRNTCARVQRLEHYTKSLGQYPGTSSFK